MPDPVTGRFDFDVSVSGDMRWLETERGHGDIYDGVGNFNSGGTFGLPIGPDSGLGVDISIGCPYVAPEP